MWLIVSLVIISILELSLDIKRLWPLHQLVAPALMPARSAVAVIALISYQNIGVVILGIITLYQVVNLARLEIGSSDLNYRRFRFLASSFWLSLMSLVVAAFIWQWNSIGLASNAAFVVLASLSLGVSLIGLINLIFNIRHYRPPYSSPVPPSKLPAVSVLVPARNETEDLVESLKCLVKSNYPKLEILVLDDCSQTKQTPDIIKSFAEHGVRFISGKEPPKDWLAKNFALAQLARAASGQLLLYMGVDVRVEPDTISQLVSCQRAVGKDMLSFMPINQWQLNLETYFVQPKRYGWEIMLPRALTSRPPVLSTCWLIKKSHLKKLGGFENVKHKIAPESYFARNSNYSFYIAVKRVGLSSRKTATAQAETGIRKRYPQLDRRIEMAAFVTLFNLGLVLGPIGLLLIGLASNYDSLVIISFAALLIYLTSFSSLINITFGRFVALGFIMEPLAALYDLYQVNYSLYKYEFSEVIWKGRNVCLPTSQITPSLPQSAPVGTKFGT